MKKHSRWEQVVANNGGLKQEPPDLSFFVIFTFFCTMVQKK